MKTMYYYLILQIFFLSPSELFSQLIPYDKKQAFKFIERQLIRSHNWELLSDDRGYTYFISKADFEANHQLVVIPVYDLLIKTDSSYRSIPNYSFYTSFILKDFSYLGIANAFDYILMSGKRYKSFAVGYDNPKLFHFVIQQGGELFYDNIGKLLAFVGVAREERG